MFCAAMALTAISSATIAGDEVSDRAKDPNLWAAPGGDAELTRHSRLKDINTTNVSKLQMIWSQSSGNIRRGGCLKATVRTWWLSAIRLPERR